MRICITVLLALSFGFLFKKKTKRKLQMIISGNRNGSRNEHAALGGTYYRNLATLNDEVIRATSVYAYVAIWLLFNMLHESLTGNSQRNFSDHVKYYPNLHPFH